MDAIEALEEQEETGGLWDDNGVTESSKMQAILDEWFRRHPSRELTGSRQDWKELREIALTMDGEESR